jgi:Domain of unknown function (DUF4412)
MRTPLPQWSQLLVPLGLSGLLAAPALAQSPFEGELTLRIKGGAELHTFVRRGKTRIEMAGPGGQQAILLMDPAAQEQYMIVPSQKMYMVMQLKDLEGMAQAMTQKTLPDTSAPANVTMERTGKSEEVAGRTCQVYRFHSEKSTMNVCLADGLGSLQAPASFWAGGGMGMLRGQAPELPPWARELKRRGAFPLRISEPDGAVVWEIIKLERKALEPALFTPPSDYRRMEMPGLGRPPAE